MMIPIFPELQFHHEVHLQVLQTPNEVPLPLHQKSAKESKRDCIKAALLIHCIFRFTMGVPKLPIIKAPSPSVELRPAVERTVSFPDAAANNKLGAPNIDNTFYFLFNMTLSRYRRGYIN